MTDSTPRQNERSLKYHVRQILRYLRVIIRPTDRVVEVNPTHQSLPGGIYSDTPRLMTDNSGETYRVENSKGSADDLLKDAHYVVIRNAIHRCYDIGQLLNNIREKIGDETKVVVVYYSSFWKPVIESFWGQQSRPMNWIAPQDLDNFGQLAGLETVSCQTRILLPVGIPIVSYLVNRFLAPWGLFSWAGLTRIQVLSKVPDKREGMDNPSVSVVVPARNESGNIEQAILRLPKMGPNDEIIFIEGNSTDDTWDRIQEVKEKYGGTHNIKIGQQDGKGKYNAVRKGFDMAENEILMILDADLTVPPEELPVFYRAISDCRGEFINGSRLVYPMEDRAMRFLNMIGNKAFAMAFSNVLGQRFKDTLCGTKVMTKENYERICANRDYFGDFDPFGDFDLIFGVSRMGLKIVEVPVHYKERTYGDTNIQRWAHGVILLKMLIFAAMRLKFI